MQLRRIILKGHDLGIEDDYGPLIGDDQGLDYLD